MTREEIQRLLDGYAADRLTAQERQTLFEAALQDQQLFNTLMEEEPVRELFADPAARRELLEALEEEPAVAAAARVRPPAPERQGWMSWMLRPWAWAAAGAFAAASVTTVFVARTYLDRPAGISMAAKQPNQPERQVAAPDAPAPVPAAPLPPDRDPAGARRSVVVSELEKKAAPSADSPRVQAGPAKDKESDLRDEVRGKELKREEAGEASTVSRGSNRLVVPDLTPPPQPAALPAPPAAAPTGGGGAAEPPKPAAPAIVAQARPAEIQKSAAPPPPPPSSPAAPAAERARIDAAAPAGAAPATAAPPAASTEGRFGGFAGFAGKSGIVARKAKQAPSQTAAARDRQAALDYRILKKTVAGVLVPVQPGEMLVRGDAVQIVVTPNVSGYLSAKLAGDAAAQRPPLFFNRVTKGVEYSFAVPPDESAVEKKLILLLADDAVKGDVQLGLQQSTDYRSQQQLAQQATAGAQPVEITLRYR